MVPDKLDLRVKCHVVTRLSEKAVWDVKLGCKLWESGGAQAKAKGCPESGLCTRWSMESCKECRWARSNQAMGEHSGVLLCLCHEIAGGLFPA